MGIHVNQFDRFILIAENERVYLEWGKMVPTLPNSTVTNYSDNHTMAEFGVGLFVTSLEAKMRVAFVLNDSTPEEIRQIDMKVQTVEADPHDFMIISMPENSSCTEAEKRMLHRFVQMEYQWMGEEDPPTLWERLSLPEPPRSG